jgi:hypothetical protein
MAQQQPRTIQPPPDLPNMPEVSNTLSGYLRNFSLWCRHGFADKISGSSAQPGVLLQAYDATGAPTTAVYQLTVKMSGSTPQLTLTPIALGSGKP